MHVSELEDPTTYLEGGELLLTTGIPLGGTQATIEAYVERLAARGVAALGLGLGEGLDIVPPELVQACAAGKLELFAVPDGVPFLDVSRAFWDLAARSGQADLIASLGTQTALARAVMRPDALPAVVKGLAHALGGWAAYLPDDGGEATLWPASARGLLPNLREETARLNVAGAHSVATFWLHGSPVVEYPIVVERTIVGFLAIGSGRTLTKADRHIIMTVCVLLALKARQQEELTATAANLGSAVAKLVVRGHVEAARLLAVDVGVGPLPERVRVLAVQTGASEPTEASAVGLRSEEDTSFLWQALAGCRLRFREDALEYFLLDTTAAVQPHGDGTAGANADGGPWDYGEQTGEPEYRDAGLPALPAAKPRTEESAAAEIGAAWTGPLSLADVAGAAGALRRAALLASAGYLMGASGDEDSRADRWVDSLAGYTRADLLGTVAAYLRHRGHWEEAARALDVHRNSLRHRMSVAEKLLGVSLDDPDVSAHLWLALRRRGF